jgi:methyltransferase-like protein
MNFDSVYRKKEDIVTRQIAGETLLIPICGRLADMQRLFALNPVAEYIWQQLDGKQNLQAIADGVLATFEVQEDQAAADIREFVSQLKEADIIEEVAS